MRQSLGVCVGITPFNFPVMVPLWMFPIAIACGNTFILKPSEKNPSVSLLLANWLMEAGLPAGVFQVIQGNHVAVNALLEHPLVKAVSFVCIVRAPDFDSEIALINAHSYANDSAIFTQSSEYAKAFSTNVETGMVGINVPIPVPMAYHSFGGWKQSLFGDLAMHGSEGVQFYTRLKTTTTRWSIQDEHKPKLGMPVF